MSNFSDINSLIHNQNNSVQLRQSIEQMLGNIYTVVTNRVDALNKTLCNSMNSGKVSLLYLMFNSC